MARAIIHPEELKRLIRDRRHRGIDRYDEVWDGVYIMAPMADNQHQEVATNLSWAVREALSDRPGIRFFAGVNVSDRQEKWKTNYRCSDVAVFLPGNPAEDRATHWLGGPDFAVEVISPYDRSRLKLPFYAKVGTREVLLLDRKPWGLELYRLQGGAMVRVGASTQDAPDVLAGAVIPVRFRLLPASPRPSIEVSRLDGPRRWLV
jgi:Uma2 family endonuclease